MLESDYLSSNLRSAIFQLHDLGQVTSPLCSVSSSKNGDSNTYLTWLLLGLNEYIHEVLKIVPGTLISIMFVNYFCYNYY